MSLAADPNQTYEYSLQEDMNLPEEKRPVFYLKFLTTRQWRELVELKERIRNAKSGEEITEMVINQVKPIIKDWKNVKGIAGEIKFSPEAIEEVLSPEDMYEMLGAEKNRQMLSAEDKKKLDSPSN